MLGSSAEIAWRSSTSLLMPYSVSSACSALADTVPSLRHAFSQPVSRIRSGAPALTIHSRCSFSDAPLSPRSAVARGLVFASVALARNRAIHLALRIAQAGSQRSARCRLVRYLGRLFHSDGWLSGRIEPLERMPALP